MAERSDANLNGGDAWHINHAILHSSSATFTAGTASPRVGTGYYNLTTAMSFGLVPWTSTFLGPDYPPSTGINDTLYPSGNTEMTIEFIARFNSVFDVTLLQTGPGHGPLKLYWDQNVINIYTRLTTGSGPTPRVRLNNSIPTDPRNPSYYLDGNWHHFALRYDYDGPGGGHDIDLFVDGVMLPLDQNGALNHDLPAPLDFSHYDPSTNPNGAGGWWVKKGSSTILDLDMDELALYTVALCDSQVNEHYRRTILSGLPYNDPSDACASCLSCNFSPPPTSICFDDFPTGYVVTQPGTLVPPTGPGPAGSVAPFSEQLKDQFPMPRYRAGVDMHPNIPTIGQITDVGRDDSPAKTGAESAVDIYSHLAEHYNYSFPLGGGNEVTVANIGIAGEYENLAIQEAVRKGYHTTLFNNWRSAHPPGQPLPYRMMENLHPDHYYQNNAGFYPLPAPNCSTMATRPLLPFVTYPDIQQNLASPHDSYFTGDGAAMDGYTQSYANALGRNVDYVAENGEMYMALSNAIRRCLAEGPDPDAQLAAAWGAYPLNADTTTFDKTFVSELWSHKVQLYRDPQLAHVNDWSCYNIGGFYTNSHYTLPENLQINLPNSRTGRTYPTPYYYPIGNENWYDDNQGRSGFSQIIEGRLVEIALGGTGDDYFAPYVAPGIHEGKNGTFMSLDHQLVRPGQYLGILKAMAVMGAEYYHTFHYMVPWFTRDPAENTVALAFHHPRLNGWQFVTPSMAQAVMSREKDLYDHSTLMEGDYGCIHDTKPRFWAGQIDRLVMARAGYGAQAGKYLITGAVLPNSNQVDNGTTCGSYVESANVAIRLHATVANCGDPFQLQFQVRRQGSTYVYDESNPAQPVFYQLDGWHEAVFPDKWNMDFELEAELYDIENAGATPFRIATRPATGAARTSDPAIINGDFRNFTSYLTMDAASLQCWPGGTGAPVFQFAFHPKNPAQSTLRLLVRARTKAASSGLAASLDGAAPIQIGCVSSLDWQWYAVDVSSSSILLTPSIDHDHMLALQPWNSDLEIDKVLLTTALSDGAITAAYPSVIPGTAASCATATAAFSYVLPACMDAVKEVDFTSTTSAASPCATYSWNFGDGSTGTGASTSHTYSAPGNYTVTLTVENSPGATSSVTQAIAVSGPTFTVTPSANPCVAGLPVTLTATSGFTAYQWSDGGTTPFIVANAEGTYSCTVTDTYGCMSMQTFEVTTSFRPTIVADGPTTLCQGQSVTLSVDNLPAGATLAWNTPGGLLTTPTVSAGASGTFQVTVILLSGCSGTASQSIVVNPLPTPVIAGPSSVDVCAGQDVTLTTGAFDAYAWSNGMATSSITVGDIGSYTVTVTENGCLGVSDPVEISHLPAAIAAFSSASTTACAGQTYDLEISFSNSSTWTFVYAVNGVPQPPVTVTGDQHVITITPATDMLFELLSAVNTVTGCVAECFNPVLVQYQPLIPPAIPVITPPDPFICKPIVTQIGLATVDPADYYRWTGGIATPTVSVVEGTYHVTVYDANGCSSVSAPVEVTNGMEVTITASLSGLVCAGGTATLDAGFWPGATYTWDGVPGSQVKVVPYTATSTTHTVRVTMPSGCFDTDSYTVPAAPLLQANAGVDHNLCLPDNKTLGGSPAATGGVPPYSYVWTSSHHGSFTVPNPSVYVTVTDNFVLTVTDFNGCVSTDVVACTFLPLPEAHGGPDQTVCAGSAFTLGGTPLGTGGTPPYDYVWNSAHHGVLFSGYPTVTALANDVLTLYVQDANGCWDDDPVNLTVVTPPSVHIMGTPSGSPCAGGTITLDAGYFPGAAYEWDGVPGTQTKTVPFGAVSTPYTVQVTYAGCVSSDTYVVPGTSAPVANAGADIFSCGPATYDLGAIPAVAGGCSPYTYLWTSTYHGTFTVPNPSVLLTQDDVFILTVRDVNGHISTDAMNVTVTPQLIVDAGPDITVCVGATVTLGGSPAISGGAAPLLGRAWGSTYHGSFGIDNPTVTITQSDVFFLYAMDDAFCEAYDEVTVTAVTSLMVSINPSPGVVTCSGTFITLDAGYFPAATYIWNGNPGGQTITVPVSAVDQDFTVVVDMGGCSGSATYTIPGSPDRPLEVDAGIDFTSCVGQSITLGGSPSADFGVPPYTYSWTSGAHGSFSTANPATTLLGSDWFTLIVTDDLGCSATETINVTANPALVVDAGPDLEVCAGTDVTLGGSPTALGGDGAYSFSWASAFHGSFPGDNPSVTITQSDVFSLTVQDDNHCVATDDVVVTVITSFPITVSGTPNPRTCAGESVTLDAGYVSGATYLWDGVPGGHTLTVPVLTTDHTYHVVVDYGTCDGLGSHTVLATTFQPLTADAGLAITACAGQTVTLGGSPAATHGVPPYSYQWTSGLHGLFTVANPMVTLTDADVFVLTVTDGMGCTATSTVTASVSRGLAAHAGSDFGACMGREIQLGNMPAATGGIAPYSYAWTSASHGSFTTQNPVVTLTTGDVFTLAVTDANACVTTDAVAVSVWSNCCTPVCTVPGTSPNLAVKGAFPSGGVTCLSASGIFSSDFACTTSTPPGSTQYVLEDDASAWPGSPGFAGVDHTQGASGLGSEFMAGKYGTPGSAFKKAWGQSISVLPGGRYLFSVWARALCGGTGCSVPAFSLQIGNRNFPAVPVNFSQGWVNLCVEYEVPMGSPAVLPFNVRVRRASGTGQVLFGLDDIEVRQMDVCSPRLAAEEEDELWSVHPNPSTGQFTLEGELEEPGLWDYKVVNTWGVTVAEGKPTQAQGVLTHDLDLSALPAGTYELIVNTASQRRLFKLVKL